MSLGNKEIMAKNIRKYLELNDMTQTDLCNALGLKFMTVSDWVNAKSYPRIDKIEMMANYFGISKADLVEEHSDRDEYYIDPKTAQIETFEKRGGWHSGSAVLRRIYMNQIDAEQRRENEMINNRFQQKFGN